MGGRAAPLPCETAFVFREQLEAAVQRVLAGDESVLAASELERIVVEDYLGDDRLDDLLEALALYAPGQGSPYTGPAELRRAVRDALATLTG